jgi:malonyl-CoA decarboxylase
VCLDLLSERGEASGAALAREVASRYRDLPIAGRETFLRSLLEETFLAEPRVVIAAAEQYRIRPDSETLAELVMAAEPPRQELFRRINLAPGGTGFLIEMRKDLLQMLPSRPELKSIDADMRHLLASWFNRGFLRLERIDWVTPALILEKLIEHEAVHAIQGWEDLRRRLESDRRCFAFFHPALPQQPLIFIEIALTRGIASSIQSLLDRSTKPLEQSRADTAVFYSITNCLDGLRGVSFGSFLIKQVVEKLQAERLNLRSFVTLSPMPDFRSWWKNLPDSRKAELTTSNERDALAALDVSGGLELRPDAEGCVKRVLKRLAAHYLLVERNGDRALDPVAAFHLGNGAAVETIHFVGDCSAKGVSQSFGLMVSYSYRPSQLERNHEAYVKKGRIPASSAVRTLLTKVRMRPRPSAEKSA